MIDADKVRDRLVNVWHRSGLTQLELAQRADISPTQINGYMRGRFIPNAENLYKICHECGATMDEVIEGTVTYERTEK